MASASSTSYFISFVDLVCHSVPAILLCREGVIGPTLQKEQRTKSPESIKPNATARPQDHKLKPSSPQVLKPNNHQAPNVVVSQALKLQNPATKKVSKIFCWLHQSEISNALPDLEEILDFLA